MNKQQIKIGDRVAAQFAWTATELPTAKNWHDGEVTEIIERRLGEHSFFYYRISGLDAPHPQDRVILIEQGETVSPAFVHLTEAKAAAALHKAHSKGWRGCVTAWNFDRTEFEVTSDSNNEYRVMLHFSDSSDEIFGSCDCLHFRNCKKICKHLALVAIDELYSTFEQRKAA